MPEVSASVDVATVRQRFNFDWATDPANVTDAYDPYWWFAVSIRVDPAEVWAEDDEGGVWVVPFTTDGADTVTFGEPVRSRLVAVPADAPAGTAATATVDRRAQRVVAEGLERPEKPAREGNITAAVRPDSEEVVMDETVRAYLEAQGIDPDVASEDQVNAANVFIAAGWTPAGLEQEPAGVELEHVAASEVQVQVPHGMRLVDEETVASMQAYVARQQERDRDDLIASAVEAGKFPPSRADHWRRAYDADPEGTSATIASLADGLIPVSGERGNPGEHSGTSAASDDALYAAWTGKKGD